MIPELKGKRIFVTGGTGFIGGRVIEILIRKHSANVRVLLNRFSTASRIARFDIEMIKADLLDSASLEQALEDCDYVIHCAYDGTNEALNVKAGENLVRAAARAKVQRVVHTSTISVYRQPNSGIWSENTAKGPRNDRYGANKLAVESAVLRAAAEVGQNIAVVQPSIVYGPWGNWTTGPLRQLSNYKVVLVNGGSGVCNAVYVDDVAEAMLLAAVHPKAQGETFLITGPDVVSWKEFWGSYEKMLGIQSTLSHTVEEIERLRQVYRQPETVISLMRKAISNSSTRQALLRISFVSMLYKIIRFKMPPCIWDLVKRIIEGPAKILDSNIGDKEGTLPLLLPEPSQIPLFASNAKIDITKATRMIEYRPQYSFEEGMARVEAWARWANLLGRQV